jgi:hypothetical protein
MPPKKKSSGQQLGRQLNKARTKQRGQRMYNREGVDAAGEFVHTTMIEDDGPALASITERNDLEEFLATAQLADEAFLVEKERMVVLTNTSFAAPVRTQATAEQVLKEPPHSYLHTTSSHAWYHRLTACLMVLFDGIV